MSWIFIHMSSKDCRLSSVYSRFVKQLPVIVIVLISRTHDIIVSIVEKQNKSDGF